MQTKNEIIQGIKNGDRTNKIYIHPIVTPEKAAKYISALANKDGGEMIFGVYDDGRMLIVKNHLVPFDLEKALKLLNTEINYKIEDFHLDGKKILYISIGRSTELVRVNDIPYVINLNGELEKMQIKTVFLSYCHADTDLADIIEAALNEYSEVEVSRDINITQYRDDLDEFMKTIRNHDYVLSIVSRKYLESLNCMYEITELMKDNNYMEKLLFIIVNEADVEFYQEQNIYENFGAGIYDFNKRLSYITYWNNKGKEMERNLKDANLPLEMIAEFALEKRKLVSIIPSTNGFMNLLKNKVGRSFKEIASNNFKEIIDVVKNKVV